MRGCPWTDTPKKDYRIQTAVLISIRCNGVEDGASSYAAYIRDERRKRYLGTLIRRRITPHT